jgi:XTP/dITP diphosphohydrolase
MKLIIASNNQHKVREIKEIVGEFFGEVLSLKEAGIQIEVEEDADTFEGNAIKKAAEIQKITGGAVLSDDSGLMVDALGGKPGVYSARFSGTPPLYEDATDEKNNEKLLKLMENVPDGQRACQFVSCVALVRPQGTVTAFGVCPGVVARDLKGDGGFGYDPLFYVEELHKTYAQLTAQEKNAVSHRGKALAALREKLQAEGTAGHADTL